MGRLRLTTVLTTGLLAFLLGLGFAHIGLLVSIQILILSLIIFLVTVFRLKTLALISIILFGFIFGWWRGQGFLQKLRPLTYLDNRKTTARVVAESDGVYDDHAQLSFEASHLQVDPGQTLPGRLIISGFGAPAVFKGDQVEISGKFYASRGSHQMRMSYAEINIISSSNSKIDTIRRSFSAGIQSSMPEPEASFGLGLLIGQRSNLPKNITNQLAAVGLTHIIAVSGYNLMIIMRFVRRFLSGRSKYQTAVISISLIIGFLLMTGLSASIVRAAIVSLLGIAAWYYGRTFRPILLIALAAALTAGINPLYLWSDIGWYLSFLAFFGILVIAPLINLRLYKTTEPSALRALLTESFSALIMTMPLIMFIFRQVSLVALPANLLLVPIVPLAMLLCLIAGLAGALVPPLAGVLAWPATIITTLMLDVVQLLSKIPSALKSVSLSISTMLFLYATILLVTFVLWHRVTSKYAKLTEIKKVF